jgi:hypothetical protein
MTDPSGRESPSTIGGFLIWQQPHFIYFADMLYRSSTHPKLTLEKYARNVFATADFMASYARFDSLRNEYVLGPALIPAQERFPPESTVNPPFELAYWSWGLETAQKWRERSGLSRDSTWQRVIDKLSPLPIRDSLYLFAETAPESYSTFTSDHPMVLGVLGFLPPTPKVNTTILAKTRRAVIDNWNWESCWGWDFPLAAMNAASLGDFSSAIDLLLMSTPKNTYLTNGHNYQDRNLTIYLPGNGGLLTAVAMLCTLTAGKGHHGFSQLNGWQVKFERLQPLHDGATGVNF